MSGRRHSGNRSKRRNNGRSGPGSDKKRSYLFKDLEGLALHQIEEKLFQIVRD